MRQKRTFEEAAGSAVFVGVNDVSCPKGLSLEKNVYLLDLAQSRSCANQLGEIERAAVIASAPSASRGHCSRGRSQ